jgi:hypothetical protein
MRGDFDSIEISMLLLIPVLVGVLLWGAVYSARHPVSPKVQVIDGCEYIRLDSNWTHKGNCTNQIHGR